ncbi:hypothetical protein CAAN1_20S01134 [[Candida] anglica]|uniref:OPA3-like protein n=1 Tax=[Candida] anglica TaxID=148631 RepID=A0ABP0EKA9_9ASCO
MSGIALKLTSLLVRTVAKPIATTLKAQAKDHDLFKNACIRIAQTVHSTDLRLRMKLLGESKIKIRPLNDKKAIENGANLLSEFFIFSVAGSLILYESYRSRKKAANERDAVADDISTLQDEIEYIKNKLREYNLKLDDYQPPAGMNPKYIKLDKRSDTKSQEDGKKQVSSSTPTNSEDSKVVATSEATVAAATVA